MKRKVVSIVLAVTLCGGTFSNTCYAQEMKGKEEFTYEVKNTVWKYNGINTDKQSPQEKNTGAITILAETTGDTEGLQYKFVWMQNDWKNWGVIQDFSEKSTTQWNPQETGEYTIYVDVKDINGNVITKTVFYEIIKPQWEYDKIVTNPAEEQKRQGEVEIKAVASGHNIEGLQYKFVWMYDNWKEWGVIRDFSGEDTMMWKVPDKAGKYKLYVDIKDQAGEVRTKIIDYFVVDRLWQPQEVDINNGIKEQVYTNIPILANAAGEIQDLQYKFVWMKDNWKKWGVIRDFEDFNQTDAWYPKEEGMYVIYVDYKDADGRVKTIAKDYEVLAPSWKVESLNIDGSSERFMGEKAKVTAVVSGDTEGLQYKFVCRRGNDWSDWEVIQEFSENNSIEIPLIKATDYNIYVDIKDQRGITFDAYTTTIHSRRYDAAVSSKAIVEKGSAVKLYPNISGTGNGECECKFVWQKDNWKEWGVIKDFSKVCNIEWIPQSVGTYTIYIDVKMNGITVTKSLQLKVENGYTDQLNEIKKYVYVPYVWGGTSTNGWDCSGFVQWAMRQMGVQVPRTSAEQSKVGTSVKLYDRQSWKPGDILLYVNNGKVGHSALYLGDGMMMHALNPRMGTYITSVDEYSRMDKNNVLTYVRRVLKY